MMSDPEDKNFILLSTDEEAQLAFEVGLITRECEYVERMVPFIAPCHRGRLMKKFIRAPRDEEKIKLIVERMGCKV